MRTAEESEALREARALRQQREAIRAARVLKLALDGLTAREVSRATGFGYWACRRLMGQAGVVAPRRGPLAFLPQGPP